MSDVSATIEVKGKLFDINANKRLKDAINQGIERMALVTEERVKNQLYKGHGVVTGNLRRTVSGELVSDLKAQIDAGAARQGANVVYASWVEGVSSRNARTSFRGYSMFRNAYKRLEGEDKDKYFAKPISEAID
tara:strand:- start:5977 stop:6378 length:402 start_codon:yes stop_codon:yes gene_type:complete